ncbi:AAA family ATPase [Mammaliicoccus vitulinus]|uniref:AAA family ATPase n=1 Tax=Mammaliicoccus vitulinus TaxID=71237 RepID=UPI002B262C48|nr:AAA family ATPase [Mammaliicoccus vitulinus]WQK88075.1 AAA family ATPase [Mammaliicoccus vitulinus]
MDNLINIKNAISNTSGIKLDKNYDALFIKQLKSSNILKENRNTSSNQSHIAITGKKNFDFFPYVNIFHYTDEELNIESMKSFYYIQVPITIYKDNIIYASSTSNLDFKNKNSIVTKASVKYSRPKSAQIELGNTTQSDENFKQFRLCFYENDFLIVLKVKGEVTYEAFIVKNQDAEKYNLTNDTEFEINKNKSTPIDVDRLIKTDNDKHIEFSKSCIYYGAPGTGKSYKLQQDSRIFGSNLRRITFHPNILYSDFIGSYKPVPTGDWQSPITYSFVPGALLKSLTEALLKPSEPHLLIIEELNRANVSATFGEMFQLLDRNSSGCSEYAIDISEDLELFFDHKIFNNQEITEELKLEIKNKMKNGLVFPENLYIWATMNSADQGVLPLDTAFKRRWDFEYFSVDNSYDEELFDTFGLIKLGENKFIKWNDVRTFINDTLSNLNVPEDKLMGPYFLAKNILDSDNNKVTQAFKNKVLMYLFEDIGSQYRNKIFNVSKLRLSTIREEFDQVGLLIFKNSELIKNKVIEDL